MRTTAARWRRRIVALLQGILSDPGEPVEVRYGESPTAHAVNRRAWCLAPPSGAALETHHGPASEPPGPRDDMLRAFAILSGAAGRRWPGSCGISPAIRSRLRTSARFPRIIRATSGKPCGSAPARRFPWYFCRVSPATSGRTASFGCRCRRTTCCIASSTAPFFGLSHPRPGADGSRL